MTKHDNTKSLRKAAERKLKDERPEKSLTSKYADLVKLMHELQVHKIELEMQNEQLRQTQIELEQSRDLYDFSPVGYITLNTEGEIKDVNLTGIKLLASHRTRLINSNFQTTIALNDRDRWDRFFRAAIDNGSNEIYKFDIDMLRADLSCFNGHIDCQYQQSMNGSFILRLIFTDNTQLKIAEREREIAAIAFESQEGIFITDVNTTIIKTNKAFTTITGYSAKEAIGRNPHMLSSGKHDVDFYSSIWQNINTTNSWHGEIWDKRKNGEVYPADLMITAVKNSTGNVTNYVGTLTDITLEKKAEREIEVLAYYDPLTQLPNRRLMVDRINHAMKTSMRTGHKGALLFLDLDHFKDLNDSLGHDVGDILLQHTAERIQASIREGDTVSRFGGDEFVVLLEGLSMLPNEAAAQAEDIAHKILSSINKPYLLAKHGYDGTTSIGLTLFNNSQLSVDELLKQADIAMYQAKNDGRNALRFFDPQMQASISARIALENELNKAIEKQQFELFYQTQVDSSQRLVGAEALIRWHHPERGLVSPVDFIPLAEQNGTILKIGQWVLDTACAQLKVWQQDVSTQDLTLSINMSAKQFHQVNFISQVLTTIQRHDVNPTRLKIELTESVLLKDIEDTISKMNALAEIGTQFSLDDFGTGYSSLQYLKKLPLYQLKIDQAFVCDLATDCSDQAIVRTIIAMARSLGLSVIAEGVDTEEQKQRLLKEGCTHFQGYLFSEPASIEDLVLS